MRILFIAPGDNPHTWKWVGWFGKKYPGEIGLIPYQDPITKDKLPGVEIISPMIPQFKIASMGSWSEFSRVKKIVRKIKPKILNALWAYGSGSCGARADYHPFVLSPWGSEITIFPKSGGVKGAIQKILIVEALNKADHVIVTSKFLGGAVRELVPRIKEPGLFPYGVDTSVFDPDIDREPFEFEWPDGAPIGDRVVTIGFFKALKPKYGPEFLIRAVGELAQNISGLRLIMGGKGEMREELESMVKRLDIDNRVIFPGRIPYESMPRALMAIDIFAMPSRYEELGVAALEASAMKKPVIVSERWGMTEVIENKKTGLFVPPEDSESLADRIRDLCLDPNLRKRMGEAGREFVKKNFEYETIMEKADRYFSDIIEKRV